MKIHARHRSAQQTQDTLRTCTEESEQHQQQQHTEASAAAGAEAGDSPARNCGTAAVVSTAAAIRQEEEHTRRWHWPDEVMITDSRFFIFRNIRSGHHQRRLRLRRGRAGGGVGNFGDGAVV